MTALPTLGHEPTVYPPVRTSAHASPTPTSGPEIALPRILAASTPGSDLLLAVWILATSAAPPPGHAGGHVAGPHPGHQKSHGSTTHAASNGRLRTLLVDDVEGIRELVRRALEAQGRFEVVGQAGNGADGIVLAAELTPDVVLLDLSMPGMDGLEALPRILEVSPASRVAIYSGFEGARLERKARERGAIGYIEKGVKPDELEASLYRLVASPDVDERG